MTKGRFTITVKVQNSSTKRYVTVEKYELQDYNDAMSKLDTLEDRYYRRGVVEFKDNQAFSRNLCK